jgi:hypothetical protein
MLKAAYKGLILTVLLCLALTYNNVQYGPRALENSTFRQTGLLNVVNRNFDFSILELPQLSTIRDALFAALQGYSYVLAEDESMAGSRHQGFVVVVKASNSFCV